MDSTQWSHAPISGAPAVCRSLDGRKPASLVLLIMASLLVALGCARRDWIDRTLVTVDVTGSWSGQPEGAQYGRPGDLVLELKQEGSTVTGMLRSATSQGTSSTGPLFGPVTGTVAGDVFRFKDRRGTLEGG